MLVQTDEEFEACLDAIKIASRVAVDTETNETKYSWARYMIGISVATTPQGPGFYLPFRHENEITLLGTGENLPLDYLADLNAVLQREGLEYVFHNAKFDLAVLKRDNIDLTGRFKDSMLISNMVDENISHALKSLGKLIDPLADDEQQKLKKVIKAVGGWTKVPPIVMAPYAVKDVLLTLQVCDLVWPKLAAQDMDVLWSREEAFCRLLQKIEERGIAIDRQRAKRLAYDSACRMQEIAHALGFDPGKPAQLARKLFAKPPGGLGLLPGTLSARKLSPSVITLSGASLNKIPVLDKAALSKYQHPVVDAVLEYRGHQKALSTWFEGFIHATSPEGRVHPDYRQHGTKTTRLSCAQPNMQQIPRTTQEEQEQGVTKALVKTMLRATEGYELWEFDYSQMEIRLGACYGQDKVMLEALSTGRDIYQVTADQLGISRFEAKTLTLALQYGAGARKIAEMLEIDADEGRQYVTAFWSTYPGLARAVNGAQAAAEARGYVRLWTGRRRHFQYPSEYRKAFNSVVQGGAAEIVKDTMLKLDKAGFLIVGQVHDSMWIEIPEGDETARSEIIEIMEWPQEQFVLPFPVDEKRLA